MSDVLEIAVLGDLHGDFHAEKDAPLLEPFPLRLCTGDLTPNGGRLRFDEAMRLSRELAAADVHVVLGNHDGPTGFTGRSFPRSYHRLESAFGELHVGGRRIERPDLGLSLIGGRPLTEGGPSLRFAVPGREDWSLERWAAHVGESIASAEQERIVVLAHCGPTGLGASRGDLYGKDFDRAEGDWGDPDLRAALILASGRGRVPVAVVAGHMHHALRGGGRRRRSLREGGTLHLNAAVVPRIRGELRALTVLRLEGDRATARIEWHGPEGLVETEDLEDEATSPN